MIEVIFLVVFLLAMVGVGVWGLKKTKTVQDFFLGGRSIGPWISAFAYGTTYFSAVIFIGFAGKQGWSFGWNAMWIALGNAGLGALLSWFVLGRRTRRMTSNLDTMTMPEFFQERYEAKWLKAFAAIVIFVFLLPYSASIFQGLGYLFEKVFNLKYDYALLIMIGITGIYLVLGGYFAVTLTDFIQGIIMLGGCVVMVLILGAKAGGFSGLVGRVSGLYNEHFPAVGQAASTMLSYQKRPDWLTVVSLVFMTSFGVWGLPQMVQKFYSVKNEKVIPRAAIITFIFALVIGSTAYFGGALTHVFYTNDIAKADAKTPLLPVVAKDFKTDEGLSRLDIRVDPVTGLASEKANGQLVSDPKKLAVVPDRIIPAMMVANLPDLVMAIILLLVLSASMSTLASLVLVSSSAIAIDLYQGHANSAEAKSRSLPLMRFLSGLFVVISYFIASRKIGFIVTLMSLSWGCIAGAFLAPYLLSLYWKRTTKLGVYAGMLTGLATMILLFFLRGAAQSPLWASIAMLAPFPVVVVVSLCTKAPSKEAIDKAFA